MIEYDDHEYLFEGFSLFSHTPLTNVSAPHIWSWIKYNKQIQTLPKFYFFNNAVAAILPPAVPQSRTLYELFFQRYEVHKFAKNNLTEILTFISYSYLSAFITSYNNED